MDKTVEVPNSLLVTENSLQVDLFFNDSFFGFQGHFPEWSLLPGVIQLETVLTYSTILFGAPLKLVGIPQIKFSIPLLPNEKLRLRIDSDGKGKRLKVRFTYFTLRKDSERVASRGKLVLCQ